MVFRVFALLLLLPLSSFAQKFVKFKVGSPRAKAAVYSPDKTLLAISEGSDVHFYTAGTASLARKLKAGKSKVNGLEFDETGEHLLVVFDRDISILDVKSGEVIKTYPASGNIVQAGYAGRQWVAYISDKNLRMINMDDKSVVYDKVLPAKGAKSFSVTNDREMIVIGCSDGKILLYKAQTGELITEKTISKGWIRTIDTFSERGLIAAGDDKGDVLLLRTSGEDLIKLSENKGWVNAVQFSDDGQYLAAGDDHGNCLVYSVEKNIVSLRINELQYAVLAVDFRDDGKELAVIEEFEGVRVADISGLNIAPIYKFKNNEDVLPPQVFISNPPNIQDDRIRVSDDMIAIKGVVIDDAGVQTLKVNGVQTPIKENGNFVVYTPLAMGDNFITIEVSDINRNTAIKKFTITRKDLNGEKYDPSTARNYLFIVGINDYEHWPKLNNAVKDVTDLTALLMTEYSFDFSNVIMLKDEQATRNNIFKSLRSFIEKIGPNDNLLIYFSGHGDFDELINEGYWVPVDAKAGARGDYLSNSDLLKIVGNINSQHTLLVADACFSGALFADSKRGFTENVERYKSRWGLASGRLEVVSDGQINQNSPFSAALLEFLRTNTKDKFPVSEMVQFVKVKVSESAKQTPLGNPLKGIGDEGGEFVFYKKR